MKQYATKKLSHLDKETREVLESEAFVVLLPCICYTYVQALKRQQRDGYILFLNEALS